MRLLTLVGGVQDVIVHVVEQPLHLAARHLIREANACANGLLTPSPAAQIVVIDQRADRETSTAEALFAAFSALLIRMP
jgi:hypothetical protein